MKMLSFITSLISLEEIASALKVSWGRAPSILHNRLGCCKVCARWTPPSRPHILTPQQKRGWVTYSTTLLKMYENCDQRHPCKMVTGDETWQYYSEPLRKAINKAWVPKGGSHPKLRGNAALRRRYHTQYFWLRGHYATETMQSRKKHHRRVLQRLWVFFPKLLLLKSSTNLGQCGIKLLHDNAPAHKSKLVQEYLSKENTQTLPHTLSNPRVLHHVIFFLFPHLQKSLSGMYRTKYSLKGHTDRNRHKKRID